MGLLVSCSGPERPDSGAEETANRFSSALAAGQGEAACALLSPLAKEEVSQTQGEPCPEAITAMKLEVSGRVSDVSAYLRTAEVRYADSTAFMSRFDGQWRIFAAGCTPRPGLPDDCALQGS